MSPPSPLPGVEEAKKSLEGAKRVPATMGEEEQPPAAAAKLFGGPAETCEEKIQSHLRSLRKVLAEFLDWRASEEKRRLDYLETSEAERRRVGAEFERLRRVLAEKERAVLGRLAELDATFETAQAEKSLRVAEGIARLQGLIGQLEAKRLPQDIGSILSSWSEPRLHLPSGLPAELEKSLSSCRRQRAALQEALEEFRGTGRPETKPGTRNCPSTEEKAKAPPEPGTAPLPQLLADRKSVRWDEEERDGAGEPRRGQEPATPGICRTRTR
ncbi:E3 ubiquitin-protein ligase TRIM7-like [Aptenodytes patagonicus]|uniref:E3 ubiquitin-protein ligase TRIM7-like n=1 Tax=Aptenodytes patagonicus TaxID=9234 RepID=UPI003F9FF9E4